MPALVVNPVAVTFSAILWDFAVPIVFKRLPFTCLPDPKHQNDLTQRTPRKSADEAGELVIHVE